MFRCQNFSRKAEGPLISHSALIIEAQAADDVRVSGFYPGNPLDQIPNQRAYRLIRQALADLNREEIRKMVESLELHPGYRLRPVLRKSVSASIKAIPEEIVP